MLVTTASLLPGTCSCRVLLVPRRRLASRRGPGAPRTEAAGGGGALGGGRGAESAERRRGMELTQKVSRWSYCRRSFLDLLGFLDHRNCGVKQFVLILANGPTHSGSELGIQVLFQCPDLFDAVRKLWRAKGLFPGIDVP